MAETAAPPERGGGGLAMITRKVGPLPLWAYAALLVVAYVAYKHFKGGGSSGTTSTTPPQQGDVVANPVPGFDAAGASGGGGIGATSTPSTVNNYYYGDQAAGQAAGGGTATFGPNPPSLERISYPGNPINTPRPQSQGGQPTQRPVDSGFVTSPAIPPAFAVGARGLTPSRPGSGY